MAEAVMTAASAPDELKRLAAAAAVAEAEDGMVLGLGSGSTAALAVDALGKRVAEEGLKVVGVPTSERTAALARRFGVPLTSFAEHRRIDLTIDGADQVEVGSLNLVKGLGGALLREKIVAAASDRLVIVVDEGKLAPRLSLPVPVEVVTFGWQATQRRIADLGGHPVLRATDGTAYRTDGGNMILDCAFGSIANPALLDRQLRDIVGVVETGLFIQRTSKVQVAGASGVRVLTKN
jgi:ribose 5-phosphate isomerase A